MDNEALKVFNDALPKAAQQNAEPMQFAEEESEQKMSDKIVRKYTDDYDPDNPTDIQKEALGYKWDPQKDKSAEEFLRTYPLTREIADSHKRQKALERKIDELANMVADAQRAGYEQALADLNQERANAIKKGDIARVDALEEQIQNTKAAVKQNQTTEPDPEVREYVAQAAWMRDKDPTSVRMQKYLTSVDKEVAVNYLDSAGRLVDAEGYVKALDTEMREAFPHYFNKAPSHGSQVASVESDEAPLGRPRKTGDPSYNNLNAKEKEMADYFKDFSKGKLTGDHYAKRLAEHKDAIAQKVSNNPRAERLVQVKNKG